MSELPQSKAEAVTESIQGSRLWMLYRFNKNATKDAGYSKHGNLKRNQVCLQANTRCSYCQCWYFRDLESSEFRLIGVSSNQSFELSQIRVIRVPSYHIFELSEFRVITVSSYKSYELSQFWVTRVSSYQFRIIRVSSYQSFELSRFLI